ncbi:MAG TPA: hypothetical protein VMB71_14325, partial [Acetobacteraceae bacterium]|nr:hypothetical protein [Acetobacteraceae bacterium]
VAYSGFAPTEKLLMQHLEVNEYSSPEWWAVVIAAASGGAKAQDAAATIGRPAFRLRFLMDYLPSVLGLLRHETHTPARPGSLMMVLPEENGKFSSPARLATALESVATLYEATAELNGQSSTDLVVTACDSGKDKLFEFQGTPDLIDKLKELLLDLWDNAIYYREKKFAERQDLIAKNLPVLAQIAGLEEKKQMQPEKAELLRRKFIAGAGKFFEAGASIPDMDKFANYQPRDVLAPKETLLLAARGL